MNNPLDRRHFIQLTTGGSIAIALGACDSDDDGGDDGGGTAAATGDDSGDVSSDGMADTADTAGMDDSMADPCEDGAPAQMISGNHGHAVTVSGDDIVAGTGGDYDITGTSSHAHMITLTADDMTALAAGEDVVVESTDGAAHTHTVTIGC